MLVHERLATGGKVALSFAWAGDKEKAPTLCLPSKVEAFSL
jgi:hypothetical protein